MGRVSISARVWICIEVWRLRSIPYIYRVYSGEEKKNPYLRINAILASKDFDCSFKIWQFI